MNLSEEQIAAVKERLAELSDEELTEVFLFDTKLWPYAMAEIQRRKDPHDEH